jgi:hypothetical protein
MANLQTLVGIAVRLFSIGWLLQGVGLPAYLAVMRISGSPVSQAAGDDWFVSFLFALVGIGLFFVSGRLLRLGDALELAAAQRANAADGQSRR